MNKKEIKQQNKLVSAFCDAGAADYSEKDELLDKVDPYCDTSYCDW